MTKVLNLIFICSFLIIISFPTLSMLSDVTLKKSDFENRSLAPFPNLAQYSKELNLLPDALLYFYNDHFGFRKKMIKMKTKVEANLFSLHSNIYMLQGKNDFYFLNPIRPKSTDPNLNYNTLFFTADELKTIKEVLEKEDAWFKQRNIVYMFVIIPDKEAVYPEYFPYPNHIITNFKLDQLKDYLEHNSTFRLVDIRQTLIDAKDEKIVFYYKGDSHWNEYGAFFAYQEIMRKLSHVNPKVYVPQLDDFEIQTKDNETITGDIVRIGKLSEGGYEIQTRLIPKPEFASRKKLKKVFIYGDSFAKNMIEEEPVGLVPFLHYSFEDVYEEHFETPVQQQRNEISPLEFDLIDKEKPELVIREIIQRNMRILLGPEYRIQ